MTIARHQDSYAANKGYLVGGRQLNESAQVQAAQGWRASGKHCIQTTDVVPPPHTQGLALITGDAQSVESYTAKFRFFNHTYNMWVEYDDELPLYTGGYFEGIYQGFGQGYISRASWSPVQGPRYGAIPLLLSGEVVPASYDPVLGALVPLISPPADTPAVEFYTTASVEITPADNTTENYTFAVIESQSPGSAQWRPRQAIYWQTPENVGEFFADSRSTFVTIPCLSEPTQGTLIRVRIGRATDYPMAVDEARIRFTGAGRISANNRAVDRTAYQHNTGGETLSGGWQIDSDISGRYKDQPVVSQEAGVFEVSYVDPNDAWLIGIELTISVSNQELSSTVSSGQESPATPYTLTEGISQTSGGQQSASSASSEQSLGYCSVTLVSDVICDADGRVIEVCYRTIAIPKIFDNCVPSQISPEYCVSCDVLSSSSSSDLTYSVSSSSSSTVLLLSSSSSSSTLLQLTSSSSSSTLLQLTSSSSSSTLLQLTSSSSSSSQSSSFGISSSSSSSSTTSDLSDRSQTLSISESSASSPSSPSSVTSLSSLTTDLSSQSTPGTSSQSSLSSLGSFSFDDCQGECGWVWDADELIWFLGWGGCEGVGELGSSEAPDARCYCPYPDYDGINPVSIAYTDCDFYVSGP